MHCFLWCERIKRMLAFSAESKEYVDAPREKMIVLTGLSFFRGSNNTVPPNVSETSASEGEKQCYL